jgi:hypothetical protein
MIDEKSVDDIVEKLHYAHIDKRDEYPYRVTRAADNGSYIAHREEEAGWSVRVEQDNAPEVGGTRGHELLGESKSEGEVLITKQYLSQETVDNLSLATSSDCL